MRILLISNPSRPDFHNYIVDELLQHEIILLWHYDLKMYEDQKNTFIPKSVEMVYWKNFKTPKELLEKVKPDRILFFEIIDFWQIPLIIAAHFFKITTFFIEHGVGNSVEQVIKRFDEQAPVLERGKYYFKKLIFNFKKIISNRIYFYSVCKYLPRDQVVKFLKLPWFYKKYLPLEALSKLKFRFRTPHYAILFNNNNIKPFLLYNEIEGQNIIAEGVPFFDKFFVSHTKKNTHLVFIEHPYLEDKLFNWTPVFHEKLARLLESFAKSNNKKIFIKLHPKSNISNWTNYNLDKEVISVLQNEDITTQLLEAELILGYSSTLLNVMICCKKNVVLLGWHPKPVIFGDDFSKTGLCHKSLNIEELCEKYEYWVSQNLTEENEVHYQNFLKEYNYPFDGRATERVIKAITENGNS